MSVLHSFPSIIGMSSQTKWLGKASLDKLCITSGEGEGDGDEHGAVGKRKACNNLKINVEIVKR